MQASADTGLFEAIVKHLSDGVYVILDNRIVFLNDRFGEIFGYDSVEALRDEKMFEDVYPDRQSVDLFRRIHEQLLTGNPPRVAWGQTATRLDGTPFWMEIEARRIGISGRPAILGTFHDRTDCKLIGQAMHVSQETLRLLMDAMEDRVYVVTDEYRIVYANRKMMESLCGDLETDYCYKVCRGLDHRCEDCSTDKVFASDRPIYKEFFNEQTGRWYSVIELAVRMPGIERPTKLAVARDITRRKDAEKNIRALSHRLISAQEDERKRISRELHDDLGQRLNAVKIGIETLVDDLEGAPANFRDKVRNLSNILDSSIQSVRQLSAGLHPSTLERLGLVETIRSHCQRFSSLHNLRLDFRSAGMKEVKLDSDIEINLFRVVQEALHNVVRHAEASGVSIRLTASHPTIRLLIEDNGKGFDLGKLTAAGDKSLHLGVVGMAERVELMNGTFRILSQPGAGTRIVVEVPLKS